MASRNLRASHVLKNLRAKNEDDTNYQEFARGGGKGGKRKELRLDISSASPKADFSLRGLVVRAAATLLKISTGYHPAVNVPCEQSGQVMSVIKPEKNRVATREVKLNQIFFRSEPCNPHEKVPEPDRDSTLF